MKFFTESSHDQEPKVIIDVDSLKIESPPKKQIWVSFDDRMGHSLLTEDKWLIQTGKCLNDRIISGWQFLLQQKFSHCGGLYPAVLAYHGKYKSDTKKSGIVQVLNSEGKHWVAISTIGCSSSVVNWLDSLHGIPSMHHEKLIAQLHQCADEYIQINIVNVDVQEGNFDCGLFSLANITAILNGVDISMIKFDQKQMRQHLVSCFEKKTPEVFPLESRSLRSKRRRKILKSYKLNIYCACRLPDDGNLMIKCSTCKEWFHKSCINSVKSDFELKKEKNWRCLTCVPELIQ